MQYIILDLEWNQPQWSCPMVMQPVPLLGEIIQIGAVKTDETLKQLDTFKILVHPVKYRVMHKKVARITGLSEDDFSFGFLFTRAIKLFRKWCGDDYRLLTWGSDDEEILRSNMALHKYPSEWLPEIYDAQYIFGKQIAKTDRQIALLKALDILGEEAEDPHDALADAINTVRVCRHLDLASGIAEYVPKAHRPHSVSLLERTVTAQTLPRFSNRYEAMTSDAIKSFMCPVCNSLITCDGWTKKASEVHICIAECPDCSKYYVRVRLRPDGKDKVKASRRIYELTDELLAEYKEHLEEKEQKRAAWEAAHIDSQFPEITEALE